MAKKKSDLFQSPKEALDEQIYSGKPMTEDLKAQFGQELAALDEPQVVEGELHIGDFVMDTNQLELRFLGDDLTREDWLNMGRYLRQHQDTIQWMIGDWACMAEPYLDEWIDTDDDLWQKLKDKDTPEGKYAWLAAQTDYSYSSLTKFKHCASAFPVFRRRKTLTYSHHMEAAKLPTPEQQDYFLDLAEPTENQKRLSVRELRERIQQETDSQLTDGTPEPAAPLEQNIQKLKEYTNPKKWRKLPKSRQEEIYHELQSILHQIEELGFED